ncbi:MAG: hypothetical protein LH650_16005 [Chloroflexi bacterium]|nr:hypothetical protein [Chloroflexota bacterium]
MQGTTESGGFRGAIGGQRSFADGGTLGSGLGMTPSGSVASPFDGLDGSRLAGPSGSHPLAIVTAEELLRPTTGGLEGTIELTGPVRVGEGIAGTLRVRVRHAIAARSAGIRLVGMLITEQPRSTQTETSPAHDGVPASTTTTSWIEVHGRVIDDLTFTEPVLPTLMAPGQVLDIPFSIPAPRLGPPSAHAGSAMIAWALEAHWDIQMGADEHIAVVVPIAQHPDLLRSGAVTLPASAMFDSVDDEGASLGVTPLPPLPAGTPVTLSVAWPGAPGGRSARVELTTDVRAANGLSVVSVSLPIDHDALTGTQVVVPLPADLPPTLDTDGLTVGHRLRVIVDRKMRSDVTAERPIVVI